MNLRLVCTAVVLVAVFFGVRAFLQNSDGERKGAAIVEVSVPALNAAAKRGENAFNDKCASCHGENAAGQDGVAPPLIHKIYEPNHHGDMAFVLAAKKGVRQHHWPFGNMPPVQEITDDEIKNIVGYVRTLQRANGIR